VIRPATEADLDAVAGIWYVNELAEDPSSPPPPGSRPTGELYHHLFASGTMVVADEGGSIVGFACSVLRGRIRFLTDLFVLPELQGQGRGATLLEDVMPPEDGVTQATLSSKDPRAQALYIRAGMSALWPHLALRAGSSELDLESDPDARGIQVVEASEGDQPLLVEWDARVSGRPRPEDHAFWTRERRAVPLLFEREGKRAGYGYVQLASPMALWEPDRATVGPIGVDDADDAAPCVAAAVRWAAERTRAVGIFLPGPHPAIGRLLRAGFRITYVELFHGAGQEFVDPTRYLSSGSDLF
jgi:GNAT superfamily N-acetyltransferase